MMKFLNHGSKGFTLIELLVVVSIISLLSSVIFASMTSARNKGKDSAIRTEMLQLRNLMELNYSQYGSYTYLQPSGVEWVPSASPSTIYNCSTGVAGTTAISLNATSIYTAKAREICAKIVSLQGSQSISQNIFFGHEVNSPSKFSIMAWLPGKAVYMCVGSNGRISETSTGNISGGANPGWVNYAGCWSDPGL